MASTWIWLTSLQESSQWVSLLLLTVGRTGIGTILIKWLTFLRSSMGANTLFIIWVELNMIQRHLISKSSLQLGEIIIVQLFHCCPHFVLRSITILKMIQKMSSLFIVMQVKVEPAHWSAAISCFAASQTQRKTPLHIMAGRDSVLEEV